MTKKILVIRFSSIGDIVLTTPVVRALYEQLGAEVHFLTKKTFAPFVASNPYLKKVHILPDDFHRLVEDLRKERYDFIIDLHHNLRTQRLKLLLRRPSKSFYKLNFEKWLLVRFHINRLPQQHIVDRYMGTGASLGIVPDGKGLDFFIPAEKKIDTMAGFDFEPGSYVAVVTGAAHQTKSLTTEQLIAICNLLHVPVVLLGGNKEKEKANAILQATSNPKVFNACGAYDILQTASIIQQAGSILSHDTGMMHIAAALKKPQVVVWGNTIPGFGMYPYYGDKPVNWISFEQNELSCRPCTKLGFEKCPKGHFKCILDHDIPAIVSATKSLLVAGS